VQLINSNDLKGKGNVVYMAT